MSTSLGTDQMRNEYSQAKKFWRWMLGTQAGLMIVSFTASFSPWPIVSTLVGVGGLVGAAALFWLRVQADDHYERGEAIRRATLLADALGVQPDPADVARLLAEATDHQSLDPKPIGNYYNSALPQGPRRLAHLLWESAHFTNQQAKIVAGQCMAAAIVGPALIVIFFLVAVPAGAVPGLADHPSFLLQHGAHIATAAGTLLAVFGLGTFAELRRNFNALATMGEVTCHRCEALTRDVSVTLPRVLFVLEEYNCALAKAAPLPSYVWEQSQKKLTDSWDQASSFISN